MLLAGAAPYREGVKVLVVDDARPVRLRFAALFTSVAGVDEVIEAATTDEALDALQVHAPDIVVLDLNLSGGGGPAFVSRVRRDRPVSLLVVVTNQVTEQHRRQLLALGADAFFDKSRDFDGVVRLVGSYAARPSSPTQEGGGG
ncbi:MAG: response regulator transcription factor [Polyangiaceae bacterium]